MSRSWVEVICEACGGSGEVVVPWDDGYASWTTEDVCDECDGRGWHLAEQGA